MRSIKHASKFRKDLKREYRTFGATEIDYLLDPVLNLLCQDYPLPFKYKDHPPKGKFLGARDCHLRPDLILIYRKIGKDILLLEQLGSQSEIL